MNGGEIAVEQPVRWQVRAKPLGVWSLYLSPFFIPALYIARFGVNVPFLDEWITPPLLRMMRQGSFDFYGLVWQAHNDHRMVVPKLIWTGLGLLTNFNVKFNMFVGLGCVLGAYAGMARFAASQLAGSILPHLCVITAGTLLFSLVHYDTWLMGFQLNYILALCFAIAAILVFYLTPWPAAARCRVSFCFCFLATFSSGVGILSWLVALPAVFCSFDRTRRWWACLWMLGGLFLAVVIYKLDYRPPTLWRTDPKFMLHHPWDVASFGLALLGAPFCQGPGLHPAQSAPIIGAILCLGFVVLAGAAIRQGRLNQAVPWLSVGLLGLGCAGLTAYGRASWGVETAAMTSRYMISTIWLPVAIVFLAGQLATTAASRTLTILMATTMILSHLLAYSHAIHMGQTLRTERSDAALFLEVEPYINKKTDTDQRSLLYPLYPVPGYVGELRHPAEMLGEDGYRRIERHATFEERSSVAGCFEVTSVVTDARRATNSPDFLLRGWAVLPDRAVPGIVLISAGDEHTFIGGARVGKVGRPDTAAAMKDPALGRCGWQTSISREFLPSENAELKAWAYDAANSKFLQLTNCSTHSDISHVD